VTVVTQGVTATGTEIIVRNYQLPIAPQHVLGSLDAELILVRRPPGADTAADAEVVHEVADALVEGAADVFAQGVAAAMIRSRRLFDGAQATEAPLPPPGGTLLLEQGPVRQSLGSGTGPLTGPRLLQLFPKLVPFDDDAGQLVRLLLKRLAKRHQFFLILPPELGDLLLGLVHAPPGLVALGLELLLRVGRRHLGLLGLGLRLGEKDLEGDDAFGLEARAAPFQFFGAAAAGTVGAGSGRAGGEHAGRRGDGPHGDGIEGAFRQSGLERRTSVALFRLGRAIARRQGMVACRRHRWHV